LDVLPTLTRAGKMIELLLTHVRKCICDVTKRPRRPLPGGEAGALSPLYWFPTCPTALANDYR